MEKNLVLHRNGTVSIVQMPHEDGGFTHIVASPTRNGFLYFVAHRVNRRTKKMNILSRGYRNLDKAFERFYRALKTAKLNAHPWDPMWKKVCAWESEYVDKHFQQERLTTDQMLALIYRVCGQRKITPPKVLFVKGAHFCYFKRCERGDPHMVMSEGAELSNSGFVLHEMAHFLADSISPNIDNHGVLFMQSYLGLLRDFTDLGLDYLLEGARKHGVRYRLP